MLGYWPGSAVHQRAALEHVRFEDFEYKSFEDDEEDCLSWFGNGRIVAAELDASTTGYLDTVDVPPCPSKSLTSASTSLSLATDSDFEVFMK